MRYLFVILTCLLFGTVPAAAKRVALVIGNDAYEAVPQLQKAVNDARAVAQSLARLDFAVDLGENLTRRQINAKFADFVEHISPGDTAFFFFAGHGVAIDGQNILLPIDIPDSSNAGLVRDEAHVVDDLLARVQGKGAAVSFFVLDACRNNPFASKGGRSVGATRGLQVVAPPTGTFVLMSAGAGQEALDRLGDNDANPNSIFTRTLLPLLQRPGMSHIALAKAVQSEVEATAKTVGRKQQPAFYDQITGEIVLLPGGSQATPVETAKETPDETNNRGSVQVEVDPALEEWNAIKDLRSLKIHQAFLRKFPDSRYADYARALVEELETEAASKAKVEEVKQVPDTDEDVEPEANTELETQRVSAGWFVILGSFPQGQAEKARKRAGLMRNRGYDVSIIDTNNYRSLADGLYSVVMGPYKKSTALRELGNAQQVVGDAYIKEIR
ncbi:caspase family protein [Sinorhizobium sp. RAC02]|uniref:caspase family protein n=1 Tax=Sinorhizobium sp. RAC02 TaxID=1842534 RepID=UPI000855C54C|nr:caspase family protein [Sinorhizobium sp. RAC02]AOF88471.1 caspase domain protein [Sinorhizobium sp. RAC02]